MNPFTAMRELFGPNGEGWGQGAYGDLLHGPNCLVGAARRVVGFSPALRDDAERWAAFAALGDLDDLMLRQLRLKDSSCRGVADFNDDPERTFADIRWLLDECEAEWELQQ